MVNHVDKYIVVVGVSAAGGVMSGWCISRVCIDANSVCCLNISIYARRASLNEGGGRVTERERWYAVVNKRRQEDARAAEEDEWQKLE